MLRSLVEARSNAPPSVAGLGDMTRLAEDLKHSIEGEVRFDAGSRAQLYDDPLVEKNIWQVRESGLGATAHVPNKPITWEGWEDSSVPPEKLGAYLRKLRALFEKYGYACDLYGHFGQGCVHTRIDFDLETAAGIAKFREFIHEAAHLVTSMGGSISGEHGDGQSKAEFMSPERRITPFAAQSDTLIVADGFSCREQIVQTTGCEALYLAQVLQMALQE
jgi:FAD/FMN-containing dehydrogenase